MPDAFLDNGSTTLVGSMDGGTAVTVLGDYLDESDDDDFSGGVLNPAKWGSAVAGSGSVVVDQVLRIRTGSTAASSATVTSVPAFESVSDLRLSFAIEQDVLLRPPSATTRLFEVELQVNATNYFRVSRQYDATMGHVLRITCVIGGTTTENVVVASTAQRGTVRITRVRGRMTVWLNSAPVYDGAPFVADTAALLVFRTVSASAVGYDCSVAIDDFEVATIVLFDAEPGSVLRIDADHVRVSSPSAMLPGTVTIALHTCAGLIDSLSDAFRYVLSQEFRVLQNQAVSVGLLNDKTLRNLTSGRQGFGS